MKENILIVSYDQGLSRKIADKLADIFSMRVFSAIELFEFDNAPRTLSEMIAIRGVDYVKSELAGAVKFSTDYENVVFVADISMHETCMDFMPKVISKYLVILLQSDPESEEISLANKIYDSYERELLYHNREYLEIAENSLSEIADVVVQITGKSDDEIVADTLGAIKAIYNLN